MTTNGEPAVVEQVPADPQPAAAQPTAATTPTDVVIEATPDEDVKSGDPLRKRATKAAADATTTWLGLYRQPPSISDAWRLSSIIDRKRIPDESGLLATAWFILNRTERILLFALIVVLLATVSTLLWCACTPTRRIGLYITVVVVFVLPRMVG